MSAFCEDARVVSIYPQGIFGERRDERKALIRCLQWGVKITEAERKPSFYSAQEFIDGALTRRLRVAFLPSCSDKSSSSDLKEFFELFKHYSVPSAVLAERMRSVNHAFGSSAAVGDKAHVAWCHFLCRQVDLKGREIQNTGYLRTEQGRQSQTSSALNLWIMCDFFLHSAYDGTVTLLCFDAPKRVEERFEQLLIKDSWEDILTEPYLLFSIVFDELHELFDDISKRLAVALRKVEELAINQSRAPKLSFESLHEIQKNCIFMIETAEAVTSTLEAILETLKDPDEPCASKSDRTQTIRAFEYRRRTFKSTLMRVYSLDKRALASIQVYQALVTQADSHAMKFIAVLTLVFLPVTGVSTVFSSPFFDVDFDQTSRPLRVAACIWVFWSVVGPLTVGTGLLCWLWLRFPDVSASLRSWWEKQMSVRKERKGVKVEERRKRKEGKEGKVGV